LRANETKSLARTDRVRTTTAKRRDYHPWRHAQSLGVDVVFVDLPERCLGYWDADARTVFLQRGLTQRQRRSVLAHEIEHASHDDRPLLDAVLHARRERATDAAAARRLITLEQLVDAMRWTGEVRELADCLWVDQHTVRVRLASLTPAEERALEAVVQPWH
jgi:hypothetical protein